MADWFDANPFPGQTQSSFLPQTDWSGRLTTGQGSLIDAGRMGGNTGFTGGANPTGTLAGGWWNPPGLTSPASATTWPSQTGAPPGYNGTDQVWGGPPGVGPIGAPGSYNTSESGGGPPSAQGFGNLSDPQAWMALVNNPQQLTSWIKSQNPGWSDDLVNYYAGVIKGQPGANPNEQAGSAQYYMQKFKGDPFYGGQGQSGFSNGLNGPVGATPFNFSFNQDDPSFKFVMQEALDAVNRGNSAKGIGLTGGALKELQNRAAGLASTEYGNAFNRAFNTHQSNFSNALNANNQAFGQNFNLANLGLQATTSGINAANGLAGQGLQNANLGQNFANNQANLLTGQGNVTGSGIIGSNNAWNQFYRNLGNFGQGAFA